MKTKKFTLQITTKLKAKDPSAVTVKEVLAHDMGYGEKIVSVGREDLWELETEAKDRESALMLAEDIAKKTWVFYNPNKHILKLGIKREDTLKEKIRDELRFTRTIRTRFKEDEKELSALKFLKETFKGADRIKDIKKYTLWQLEINATSEEEADRIADEIAVNRTIGQGLLANPGSQEVSWRQAEKYLPPEQDPPFLTPPAK